MRIIVFGGTSEGKQLSHMLAEQKHEVIVCVATEYGREEQGRSAGIWVMAGRKNVDEMAELINHCDVCIDATHPYAVEATKNILEASERVNIPCIRYVRPASEIDVKEGEAEVIYVDSAAEAAAYFQDTTGNILLATGAKELPKYKDLEPSRLYPRVLPLHSSLELCESIEVPHRNIIAMQGPFSQAMNEAIMEQYQISYMVTKNSGSAGGFLEKLNACRNRNARLVIIGRDISAMNVDHKSVFSELEEVTDWCVAYEKKLKKEED